MADDPTGNSGAPDSRPRAGIGSRAAAAALRPFTDAAAAAVEAGIGLERRAVDRILISAELERLVGATADSPRIQAAIQKAMLGDGAKELIATFFESGLFDDFAERLLASKGLWRLIDEIADSPAVTAAITQQSLGFVDIVAAEARTRSRRADEWLELATRHLLRRPPRQVENVGLVTRAIAFALDAAIINLVAFFVGVAAGLIVSLFHLPHDLNVALAAIGGGVYILWLIGYFVAFWSTTGQTPGDRLMRFRIVAVDGERIKPRRAILRGVGLVLAALPLFAGYLLILFDRRRRGLQDRLAQTLAVEAPQLSIVEQRRQERRAVAAAAVGVAAAAAGLAGSSDSGDDPTPSVEEPGDQRERVTPDSADHTGAPSQS
jgi:uncharacterized RDD family membrane protein YckC